MKDELKKLKCELCGSLNYLLVRIEVSDDGFSPPKGICCSCFKGGNLSEKIFLKQKDFIKDQLQSALDRVKFWEDNYKELNK